MAMTMTMTVLRIPRDSAALALAASRALPGGPCNHAAAQRPDGRSVCFGILRPVSELPVRRIPKQPGAKALGCCWLRRERDSNSRYPFGVHTLSRRASSATRASLQYGSGRNRTAKVVKKSENPTKTGKFLWDFQKGAYSPTTFPCRNPPGSGRRRRCLRALPRRRRSAGSTSRSGTACPARRKGR